MNERIERGLRNVLSALAESVEGSSGNSPQQFGPSERTPRNRRRTQQTEDQLERDATPEEKRAPRRDIQVELATSVPTARLKDLRSQLRNRKNVRRAYLLSELLDRPRSVRPYRPPGV
jgi:hypothetical protein